MSRALLSKDKLGSSQNKLDYHYFESDANLFVKYRMEVACKSEHIRKFSSYSQCNAHPVFSSIRSDCAEMGECPSLTSQQNLRLTTSQTSPIMPLRKVTLTMAPSSTF